MDTQIFSDSMEALGLKQHPVIPTHKSNNVLDFIFTEIISDISFEAVETASYISYHCLVIAALNIKKEQVKPIQRVICKAAEISLDKWNQEFNELNIKWDYNLCNIGDQLDNELVRVYDVLAPPKQVFVTS